MARFTKVRLSSANQGFWAWLRHIVALLIGLGVAVVVWVLVTSGGQEVVLLMTTGVGIGVFWLIGWLTGGGLPRIARFRIQNESQARRVRRSGVRLRPTGGDHEDVHEPPLVPVGEGVPNGAAYEIEPPEGPLSLVTAIAELENGPLCEVPIEIDPPALSLDEAAVSVKQDRVCFTAVVEVADGILQQHYEEVDIPEPPPAPPAPGDDA